MGKGGERREWGGKKLEERVVREGRQGKGGEGQ